MIFHREKAQKTQKRDGMVSSAFSSRLRAFAPSRKKPKTRQGQPAFSFFQSFLSSWAKGTKEGLIPRVLSAAKLWSDPLAQLSVHAFLFSHEGAKARRREGAKERNRKE